MELPIIEAQPVVALLISLGYNQAMQQAELGQALVALPIPFGYVRRVNRLVHDISSTPPATIEWE